MDRTRQARKLLLPRLALTELAKSTDPQATRIQLPSSAGDEFYFVRPKKNSDGDFRNRNAAPGYLPFEFNLFPLVLDALGALWAEANVYLLSRAADSLRPTMTTFSSMADDLAAYRRFLDDTGVDWTKFPPYKLNRPTYRYSGHLKLAIAAGEVAPSTAKRRMSTVIAFYRWLRNEKALVPENTAWRESDRLIELKDVHGFKFSKQFTTTDVSIILPRQNDPYTVTIDDGGKLRPLLQHEQVWVVNALCSVKNTEMTLIQLFGLLTGARIQTILTFRVRHVRNTPAGSGHSELRIPVGPGTGIDTKNDKLQVLHLPIWFYDSLRTYAHSDRARRRRHIAEGGDTDDQYLFLSVRGTPLYRSKSDTFLSKNPDNLRHAKIGQAVRQFMSERIIPYIQQRHDPTFRYKFHDTRASYGMNLTDAQLELVVKGHISLHQAREHVKVRMGHESAATTDLYLQYRKNQQFARAVESNYNMHLQQMAERALDGRQ